VPSIARRDARPEAFEDALDAIGDGVATVLDVLRGSPHVPELVTGDAHRADGVLARVRTVHAPYWSL
jgi:hypothetical protein